MTGVASRGTWLDKVQLYANTINHMLIAMVAFYTTWMCLQLGPGNFSLHAWLCMMGYNVLMCESLMSLYKPNSWSSMHSIRTRKNLHWILQAIGGSLAMAGMIILYSLRGFQIRSIHSQLGFGSSILIIIGALSGSTAIWSAELRRLVKPVYIKLAHNLTGSLCFTMGMSALIYGYQSFVFNNTTTRETLVALQVMCALIIVLCMVGPLTSLYTQCVGSFPWIFKRFEKNDEIEDDEDDQRRNINNYT